MGVLELRLSNIGEPHNCLIDTILCLVAIQGKNGVCSMSISTPPGWEHLLPKKIIRRAAYRRVSDEDQKEGTSLSDQLEEIQKAIVKAGGVLKEDLIFTDTMSGRAVYWRDREGLQAMLAAAKRREFDELYITCLDRFGRSVIHQEFMIEELRM